MLRSLVKYPASATGAACLLLLTVLFWTSGALWPTELPDYASSSRQITGMVMMLILLPAYLLVAAFVTQRRSLDLVEQLEPLLPDPRHALDAREAIRNGLKRTWRAAAAIGLVMGLFNAQPIYALTESSAPSIDITIALGQLFMWLIVGLLGGQRALAAHSFSRLGEVVEFDLFQLDRLRPLARSGMVDALVIAGALAMSPLQALDAEFRWYNYSFGLMVSIPATLFLLVWPMRSVHRRIRVEKQRQLSRVNALIQAARGGATQENSQEDILRFETLLAHRERLRDQRTWPFSTALMSRLFIYLIIPPLAWAGAAVVEVIVARLMDR